ENRLLLLERRQRLGQRLQRAQPDVVVEHVHLGRVGRGRVVGGELLVGGRGVGRRGRRRRAFLVAQRRQRRRDLRLVGGEVGQDVELRADRRDSDHVGRRHVLVHERRCRVHRALHVFGLHRGDVEEQDDESTSRKLLGSHRLGRVVLGGRGRRGRGRG